MTPAARIAAVIEILSELPSGEIASVSAGAALRRGLQARRYAGSGITEQRRDLGGLVLDLEQTVTEFLRVVGAHTLRHADAERRQLC